MLHIIYGNIVDDKNHKNVIISLLSTRQYRFNYEDFAKEIYSLLKQFCEINESVNITLCLYSKEYSGIYKKYI